jgi:hypothetical protein
MSNSEYYCFIEILNFYSNEVRIYLRILKISSQCKESNHFKLDLCFFVSLLEKALDPNVKQEK